MEEVARRWRNERRWRGWRRLAIVGSRQWRRRSTGDSGDGGWVAAGGGKEEEEERASSDAGEISLLKMQQDRGKAGGLRD